MESSAAGKRDIEGVGDPLQARGKGSRWEQFRLPVELSGRTFLDVGCWEGMHCAEAVRRDAEQVVGVDLCTSEDLAFNVRRYGFDFLQMDIFSEKWLTLGEYDVVLCSGVLYGVENVMSLLFRLRKVVRELLVLETGITRLQPDKPMMIFHGQGEGTNNPSNWWTPNKLCLEQMLTDGRVRGDQCRLGGGAPRALLAPLRPCRPHRPPRARPDPAPQSPDDEPPRRQPDEPGQGRQGQGRRQPGTSHARRVTPPRVNRGPRGREAEHVPRMYPAGREAEHVPRMYPAGREAEHVPRMYPAGREAEHVPRMYPAGREAEHVPRMYLLRHDPRTVSGTPAGAAEEVPL